jgi:hypothetical protein
MICHVLSTTNDEGRLPEILRQIPNTKQEIRQQPNFFVTADKKGSYFFTLVVGWN